MKYYVCVYEVFEGSRIMSFGQTPANDNPIKYSMVWIWLAHWYQSGHCHFTVAVTSKFNILWFHSFHQYQWICEHANKPPHTFEPFGYSYNNDEVFLSILRLVRWDESVIVEEITCYSHHNIVWTTMCDLVCHQLRNIYAELTKHHWLVHMFCLIPLIIPDAIVSEYCVSFLSANDHTHDTIRDE